RTAPRRGGERQPLCAQAGAQGTASCAPRAGNSASAVAFRGTSLAPERSRQAFHEGQMQSALVFSISDGRAQDEPDERYRAAPVLAAPSPGLAGPLHELVQRVARGTISVLVLGETGVGKERMAEAIHHTSPRAERPLVCLNCAALSESLLESELF